MVHHRAATATTVIVAMSTSVSLFTVPPGASDQASADRPDLSIVRTDQRPQRPGHLEHLADYLRLLRAK